ncbi:hypothetical protein ACFX13_014925 [Malus domestica]
MAATGQVTGSLTVYYREVLTAVNAGEPIGLARVTNGVTSAKSTYRTILPALEIMSLVNDTRIMLLRSLLICKKKNLQRRRNKRKRSAPFCKLRQKLSAAQLSKGYTLDGGPNPQYPTNKVMIWDGHQGRCIVGLSFCSFVWSVRLRRNRIVVVLEQPKTHTESDIHSVTNDNLIINVFNSLSTASCTEAMQSMLHSKNITVSECFDDELRQK